VTGPERRVGVLAVVACALRARPRATAAAAGWTALAAGPTLLTGWAVAHSLDDGFLRHRAAVGLAWLALPALSIAPAAAATGRSVRAIGEIVESFRDRLVVDLVEGAIARAVAPAGGGDSGRVLAALSQQVEAARAGLAGTISCLLSVTLSILGVLIGQVALSPAAAALTAAPLLATALLFATGMPRVLRAQRNLVLGAEDLSAIVHSTTAGLRDIRVAGADQWARQECARRIDSQARTARLVAGLSGLRLLVVGLGGRAPAALLLLAAPWLIRHGTAPGALAGALTYDLATVAPLAQSVSDSVSTAVLPLAVNAARLAETGPARVPTVAPGPAAPVPDAVEIRIQGLGFAYGPHAEPVLAGLDLTVPHGARIAVVGASGIGKSTLAALICGVLRPSAGSIRVGGLDPADLVPATLANLRVYLPQQAYVFSGTLRDNLRYLNPDATDRHLDRAVAAVGLTAVRDRVGYDGLLDPACLDPAQRQLVALARAWASPAPLVVLDEATCHLDPGAEARVEDAFAARGGTLVVIAHRISSAMRADTVLILDGANTGVGTHRQLLTGSPMYQDLVGHWSGLPDRCPSFVL
jgi:ATP-binding cassette subfamily C protein